MVFLVASPDEEDGLPSCAAQRYNTHHFFGEEIPAKEHAIFWHMRTPSLMRNSTGISGSVALKN